MSEQTAEDAPKDVGGRPPYKPSEDVRRMVGAMCVAGLKVSVMARIVGIDRKTFRNAFRDERKLTKAKLVATLVSQLVTHTKKSVPATIFALCNLDPENWSNKHMMPGQQDTGDTEKTIKHTHTIRVIGGLRKRSQGEIIDQDGATVEGPADSELEPAHNLLSEV